MADIDDVVEELKKKFGNLPDKEKAVLRLGCLMAKHDILSLETLIDIQMLVNSLIWFCKEKQQYMIDPELMKIFTRDAAND